MPTNVMILGAGFGGLELASSLSERLAGEVEVTLVDQHDDFVFGFSKLEVLFGRQSAEQVRIPYRPMRAPGVAFRQEKVLALDPATRHVVTDAGAYDPDVIVVALGADYDVAATPGFADGGFEYYTVTGAERLRDELRSFRGGRVMLAVLSIPFKCPPAPYEAILLLHDELVGRGIRDVTDMHVVTPQPAPIPVSPQASAAFERAMGERGIAYTTRRRVYGIDPAARVARFKDHDEPYDLFIGIPVHKVPDVLSDAGLAEEGWVAVDPRTMRTGYPGVYAIGDCTETGIPKAGTFAESTAHVAADDIVRSIRGAGALAPGGTGLCYMEFGNGEVGRVDVDFHAAGGPTAPLLGPSSEYVAEKAEFGATRRARWFGA
ncbi:FAD-dependent oxidoreductase [Agromyces sp. SYSU K20354]|uniref:NAD(P)/FAD-dependent oxidoreductase n=1 Tax=Agromyces cavernae TaxID=2898659 RepID=UPI001E34968A|nr:FAD-dependent oxidoreductase [Agromyces cavernae]MCD2443291.1 FAD-dependent oxidoreductase [Agromyces cavernae]